MSDEDVNVECEHGDEIVKIDLPVHVIATLAIAAHEEDMKLNDFIMIRVKEYCEQVIDDARRNYNPKFGDDILCNCGHPYYRHFDTYEEMYPCGCKYCECDTFHEPETKQGEG